MSLKGYKGHLKKAVTFFFRDGQLVSTVAFWWIELSKHIEFIQASKYHEEEVPKH